MTFSTLPDLRAAAEPDGPAVADATTTLTNADFARRVRSVAAQLAWEGVAAHDVVGLRLTNRVEFVIVLFAAWRIGATVTPVNPALTPAEASRQLADADAKLHVIEDGSEPLPDIASIAVSELRYDLTPGGAAPDRDPRAVDDVDTLALLIYTSGTTGVPKGVMLDHANLDAMAEMGRAALQLDASDRCLLILPLFHVNGIVVSVLAPLLAGASVTIAERFSPGSFFETVERVRPTYFSAVPTIYNMLGALPDDVRPDTSSIRFGVCGAAPASAELLSAFEARYGFPLVEGYGLSEATCGSTINPVDGPRKAGTVGLPFPGQELRITAADGTPLPQGAVGEVTVSGPNVMRGYLGRPEETAAVLTDGWLRTGDVGRLDEDGYLTIVGRSKEMIIRGGENIYPKEIEDLLLSDPAVLEAAVVGVPDDTWGEVVAAFLQPRPGMAVDLDAIKELCARELSPYKRPISLTVLEALPKNAVGKLDKRSLRARG
jgi:long-chain acyl-CoA synthetase